MPTNVNGTPTGSLAKAKRRFEQWRKGRGQTGRIPKQLWLDAAHAAASHGVEKTAGLLRLDSQRLKQWVDDLKLSHKPAAQPAEAEFVELSPMLAGFPQAEAHECHVEMEEPSGRKLRIVFKGKAVSQAAAVISAVWKEARQ